MRSAPIVNHKWYRILGPIFYLKTLAFFYFFLHSFCAPKCVRAKRTMENGKKIYAKPKAKGVQDRRGAKTIMPGNTKARHQACRKTSPSAAEAPRARNTNASVARPQCTWNKRPRAIVAPTQSVGILLGGGSTDPWFLVPKNSPAF